MTVKIDTNKVVNNIITLANIIAAANSKGKEQTKIVNVDVTKKGDKK